MSLRLILALLVIIVTLACAKITPNAAKPGAKIWFPNSALQYITNQVMPLIQKQVASISIPNISGKTGTPIGDIEYSLTNIRLNGLTFANPTITVTGADEITVVINNVAANVHLDWHYRESSWPHISDGGSADCSLRTNLIIAAALDIDLSQKSTLKFSVHRFSSSITHFDLTLHGGASWLYNLFISLFSGQIKDSVQSALNSNIPSAVTEQVQEQLNTLDLQVPIGDSSYEIFINFIMKQINFNSQQEWLGLGTSAEFGRKGIAPYTAEPVDLPDRASNNSMIQVFLSDWSISSAGYAFYYTDVFKQVISWRDIPKDFPIQLNTKFFQFLIPNLYKTYPDMNMNIALDAVRPPTCTIRPDIGAEADADVYATFQVVKSDNVTSVDAFTLEMGLTLDMVAKVEGSALITATVSYKNSTLSLYKSNIGEIQVNVLQQTLKFIVQFGVLPLLNAVTQKGFPIVSGDFKLVNPAIVYNYGYITVLSDFTFDPSLNSDVIHKL